MKYYLIAGERSGDLHGSNLMKQLVVHDPEADFRFFGGDYMSAVGGSLAVHYKQLAFMGFLEVLRNLGTVRKYLRLCKEDVLAYEPDTLILIDYAGFNLRIARWAKQNNLKVLYYISPKLWAWNSKRAKKIKRYVDHMFAIMPFEVAFYKKYDYNEVSYVGNPVVDAVADFNVDEDFAKSNGLDATGKKIVAVLPGSRKQELLHILPDIVETIKRNPDHFYLVATVDNLNQELYSPLRELENVRLTQDNTYNILANAEAAIVTSGTATLETALWQVPQVVVYKGSALSIFIGRLLVNVKYISLVNLILDEPCVEELIQQDCSPERIGKALNKILNEPTDYSRLLDVLGKQSASKTTALGIIDKLSYN